MSHFRRPAFKILYIIITCHVECEAWTRLKDSHVEGGRKVCSHVEEDMKTEDPSRLANGHEEAASASCSMQAPEGRMKAGSHKIPIRLRYWYHSMINEFAYNPSSIVSYPISFQFR